MAAAPGGYPADDRAVGFHLVAWLAGHDLGRLSGIILLVVFAVYLWRSLQRTPTDIEMDTSETGKSYAVLWLFVALGVVALAGGSYLFVEGARAIARSFGVSETVIGLTIVGLGTSLPELVTSVVASRRNEADISTGNVIGSNIFNIIVVLGVLGHSQAVRAHTRPFHGPGGAAAHVRVGGDHAPLQHHRGTHFALGRCGSGSGGCRVFRCGGGDGVIVGIRAAGMPCQMEFKIHVFLKNGKDLTFHNIHI